MENHPNELVKIIRLAVLEGICVLVLLISNNFYISVVLLPVILILALIIFFRFKNFVNESVTEE